MTRAQFWFFAFGAIALLLGFSGCHWDVADEDDPPPRQGGGPGGGRGGFSLYANEAVKKDLGLTEDQTAKIQKINDDFRKSLQDIDPQDRRTKMQELRKGMDEKIAAVLDDKQQARMKEIRLQMQGISALSTKEVADSLKLTDDQKTKIADLQKSLNDARRDAFQNGGFGDPDVRDKISKLTQENETKTLDVLTAAQKADFDKMKGAKIDLPQGGFGFGGGGFGGPGGGGFGRGGGAPGGGGPSGRGPGGGN